MKKRHGFTDLGCGGTTHTSIKGKVKWTRLKAIAREIAKRKVEIHGSTELQKNIKAATQFDNEEVHIALNLNEIKSVKDVIAALSHELAHVLLETEKEGDDFQQKWVELEERIIKEYRGGEDSGEVRD